MAITSYSTLKTAMATWIVRDDATDAQMSEFVSVFEARANVELPLRTAEVDTTLTGSTSSRQLTLPSDFLEPVALFLTTYGTQQKLSPIISGNYELDTSNGPPSAWAINGSNIDLDCPCDQAHTFTFRYRMKLLNLASTDPNWLLTNHPNVYLWGSLVEFATWARDAEAISLYNGRYEDARDAVAWLTARSKATAPLRVDPALVAARSFNINSGD